MNVDTVFSTIFTAVILSLTVASEFVDQSRSTDESTRIFNGFNSSRGQFPHQAFLIISFNSGHRVCGGSLISDRWVLTAAHCLNGTRSIEIHLGALKTYQFREQGRVIYYGYPSSVFIHPHFVAEIALHDIGLVQLEESVQFTDTVQPIALPKSGEYYHDIPTIASGFGLQNTDDEHVAQILQWAPFYTINNFKCAGFFSDVASIIVLRPSIICAVGIKDASICMGDGGNPLIDKHDVLIGISSFVSGRGCHLGYPSVFMRVTYYLDWIEKVTGLNTGMQ